jgi:hypothetical protein
VEKAGESFSGVKVNYEAKYKKSLEVIKANYNTFEVPYYGNDNNDYVNGLGFCCNPSGESVSGGESSNPTGKLMAGKSIQYHPGSRRYNGCALYLKVSNGTTTVRYSATK